ncbi:Hypp990 [Branchiostoma lanceolatum]|uniref:Hypp990 protein n=1 Tax=Branchiostoma lanceolatum TaxID=7740 RepID=A0A8K0EL40_BRALA|nr:Hypp990 [Branchiostoma lanceolatum]
MAAAPHLPTVTDKRLQNAASADQSDSRVAEHLHEGCPTNSEEVTSPPSRATLCKRNGQTDPKTTLQTRVGNTTVKGFSGAYHGWTRRGRTTDVQYLQRSGNNCQHTRSFIGNVLERNSQASIASRGDPVHQPKNLHQEKKLEEHPPPEEHKQTAPPSQSKTTTAREESLKMPPLLLKACSAETPELPTTPAPETAVAKAETS